MGLRNVGSLLLILLICMMIFGTQRLRDVGHDLAIAIRNFRKGLQEDEPTEAKATTNQSDEHKP